MKQRSNIFAKIDGKHWTFTITAQTDLPRDGTIRIPPPVQAIVFFVAAFLRVALKKYFDAEVQLINGPIAVPEDEKPGGGN